MVEDAVGGGPHAHDSSRNSDDRGMIGHGANDHRAGTDFYVVADLNAPENLGACSDHDVVADRGVTLALLVAGSAERDAQVNENVVANLSGLADYHAHAVVDEETAADPGSRMDFDAGQKAGNLGDETRQNRDVGFIQAMREAVHQNRVKSGVAEDDLED